MVKIQSEYSAGIVSRLFWAIEAKKTAILFNSGMTRSQMKENVISENIYQATNVRRATRMFGYIIKRVDSVDDGLRDLMIKGDFDQVCAINLLMIMFTDKIVADFMYEVFRHKLLLGDYELSDNDFNSFIAEKSQQSKEVAAWASETIEKIRQTIYKMLLDGGFARITDKGVRNIVMPVISYELEEYLKNTGLTSYLYAITGEK